MVLPNFKENLEKYAKLLVANGINVQPGHTLALNIDVEQRDGQMISLPGKNSSMHRWIAWTTCLTTRLQR